ncbi:hypothetical protein Cgig2_030389 [Carnegiea gigantea]|uniref:Cullin N-terminal domain-containing protein n=1 Tax=Carnegiea gigantea TaxID=171969 RepID=A0A9Q1KKP3_9CARY|nr:hypothetical protein Cgig2_030389 [Carnegiea gigantea]
MHVYRVLGLEQVLEIMENGIKKLVLPSLREKHGEHMLMELVKRWSNHKAMVYREISGKAKDAVIALVRSCLAHFSGYSPAGDTAYSLLFEQINSEREDSQIDKALLKNVLAVYVEMRMGKMDCNAKDYSGKFSDQMGPCIQDKLKVAQSEEKLVSGGLMAEKLLRAWLKDDEDRSRVYWLYSKVTKELESTRNLCKQCLGDDIIALILLMERSAKKPTGKMMTLEVEGSDASENVKSAIQEEGTASNVECSILPQKRLEEGMTHARRVTLLEASLVPCPKPRRTGF